MRTIIAISLLALLAAVACGTEAPESMVTTDHTADVFHFLGTGTTQRTVSMKEGIWTVDIEYSDNEVCVSRVCHTEFFAVDLEGTDGSGWVRLVITQSDEGSSNHTIRVGRGSRHLSPGQQTFSVHAVGNWRIDLEKQG